MKNYLNFETEIKEYEDEIKKLKDPFNDSGLSQVDTEKISKTQEELDEKLRSIYENLDPWQITMVARHEDRPKSKFFIDNLFEDFIPLSGDRYYGEDKSVLTGLATFKGQSVMIMGTEKGNSMDTRLKHNFGMAKPEGYRKAQRLMMLADKFNLPIITFVDTAGAFPGKEAEERGQSESIASSIQTSLKISSPIISVVIGEGGSGGAIALATADRVMMLEHSIYSVISPEGCASILWRSSDFIIKAAENLKLTAQDCLDNKIIDSIIDETPGGAHRFKKEQYSILKNLLNLKLKELIKLPIENIVENRNNKFLNIT